MNVIALQDAIWTEGNSIPYGKTVLCYYKTYRDEGYRHFIWLGTELYWDCPQGHSYQTDVAMFQIVRWKLDENFNNL